MKLCFFEDDYRHRFDPLTLTRPTDQLRMGILTLDQKWERELGLSVDSSSRLLPPRLKNLFQQPALQDEEQVLWINPRYLPNPSLVESVEDLGSEEALVDEFSGVLVAGRLSGQDSGRRLTQNHPPNPSDFSTIFEVDAEHLDYLWELFLYNGTEITRDIERMNANRAPTETLPGNVTLHNASQIFIQEDVTLEPGTIIIADEGPVFIGRGAKIMAGSVVRGPTAICEDSVVKMGAKIYEETTIGPVCKVAGEVNNSIFHSYSNKGHEGFVGNSLFGQWCNLGADTNVSNLKNNYEKLDMRDWHSGEVIQTDQQFIGTIMGDHSKTAINTMLNTGTMCGVSNNIFASGFPPKMIPSFSWIGDSGRRVYRFDKALQTMEKMMARRDVELTDAYATMMESLFNEAQGT